MFGQAVSCLWPILHLLAGPATNWRWPFVIVALPSLLVTGVMLATTQEPPRGITEPALQVTAVAMWPYCYPPTPPPPPPALAVTCKS